MNKELEALVEILDELDHVIRDVKTEFAGSPYKAKYPDGRYVLLDALVAKANVRVAIANHKLKETQVVLH